MRKAYAGFCKDNGLKEYHERLAVAKREQEEAREAYYEDSSGNKGTGHSIKRLHGLEENAIINHGDGDTRFNRADGTLPDHYKMILKSKYESGSTIAKAVYDKYVPAGGAVSDGMYAGGPAYYSAKEDRIRMRFIADESNVRGPGTTWFHEHGHYIDNHAGRPSNDVIFAQAFKDDLSAYEISYGYTHKLRDIDDIRRGISSELISIGDKTHGLQDIFSCLIGAKYPGAKWSHGTLGLANRHVNTAAREAFAHMFEACFDQEKRVLMEQYLPMAWQSFLKMMEGLI